MSVGYSTNLQLVEPVTGTESGNWGYDINYGTTDYIDISVAGTNNITTDADVTLTQTTGSTSGNNIVGTTAQYMQLLFTGSRIAARNVNAPNISKIYVVNNSTTGGYSITVRGVTGPTTGVTVINGEKCIIAWNSVSGDFVKISSINTFSAITATTVTVTGAISTPSNLGAVNYGTLNYQDTNIVSSAQANFNGYVYSAIQNTNSGGIATTDFAVYNDQAGTRYLNLGVNSSGYGAFTGLGGTGGSSSTTLTIATASTGNLLYGAVLSGTGFSGSPTITTQLTSTGTASASPTWVSGGTTGSSSFVVSSLAGIAIGYLVSGTGVPAGTFVGSFSATGNTVNLINAAGSAVVTTTNATGTYNFYVPGGVGTYTMSAAQTVSTGTSITAQVAGAYNQNNASYVYSYGGDMVVGTLTSNNFHLVTNNSNTDAITVNTSGAVAFNGAYGTSGQALLSAGSGSAPTWGSAGISTGKAIAMALIFGF